MNSVPVILFAYARPDHLRRTLDCLRENRVPLIYAFSDGPRTVEYGSAVTQVRDLLRAIDWCEVVLCERESNMGLGRSILAGVEEILARYEMCIVFEDDLICVPGTYRYLVEGLRHYEDDSRVMSVTGWTHPLVTPSNIVDQPYFDGRAECWVWGTWARAWKGMDRDAKSLMLACESQGIDRNKYGTDLPAMAEDEAKKNIWAVRFLYHHMVNTGLCLRPPWSMVEHIGCDAQATNAHSLGPWTSAPLKPCPPLPDQWPAISEHSECPFIWQKVASPQPVQTTGLIRRVKRIFSKTAVRLKRKGHIRTLSTGQFVKSLTPPVLINGYQALRGWKQPGALSAGEEALSEDLLRLSGDYPSWAAAVSASTGYDGEAILQKTCEALLKVKRGEAVYERDSVLFDEIQYSWPVLAGLMWAAARSGGDLNVLDFGGSLGSTYYQAREFLKPLRNVRWNVVEQARHVEVGRKWFEDDRLKFYERAEDCLAETRPGVILLSGVLQYVEDPCQMLDRLLNLPCDHLIVDRTPFGEGPSDRLCIQHVPAEIYAASYPCWLFSRQKFCAWIERSMEIVAEFDGLDHFSSPVKTQWKGLIATKRKGALAKNSRAFGAGMKQTVGEVGNG